MTPEIKRLRAMLEEAKGSPVSVQIYRPSGKATVHTTAVQYHLWDAAKNFLPLLLDVAEAAEDTISGLRSALKEVYEYIKDDDCTAEDLNEWCDETTRPVEQWCIVCLARYHTIKETP